MHHACNWTVKMSCLCKWTECVVCALLSCILLSYCFFFMKTYKQGIVSFFLRFCRSFDSLVTGLCVV